MSCNPSLGRAAFSSAVIRSWICPLPSLVIPIYFLIFIHSVFILKIQFMENPRIEIDIPSGVTAKLLYSKSKVFIKPSANLKIPGILAIVERVCIWTDCKFQIDFNTALRTSRQKTICLHGNQSLVFQPMKPKCLNNKPRPLRRIQVGWGEHPLHPRGSSVY